MRIAILHNQYKLRGGTETYLFDLINGFVEQSDQVEVIVYKQDLTLNKPESYLVTQIKLPPSLRFTRPYFFARELQKKFNPDDYDLTLSITRTASQHISICGGTHRGYLNYMKKRKGLADYLEIKLEKQCFKSSNTVIAHSKLIQQEIINLYQVEPEKLQLLYPPVNTNQFNINYKNNQHSYQEKFGISRNKFSLLFPSTGHKRKGLFVLLEAFKQLPEQHFELIVAGNKLPIQTAANIKFMGFVKEMAELYAAVDATILPAYYEPFGLVVMESLQCGTPVVISPYVGAKDFVSNNEGIILEAIEPGVIKSAIEKMAQSKFSITENFIAQHNLTLNEHINSIKNLAKKKPHYSPN